MPASYQGGVVVLELFTSQGCSSCPPADRLLTELASDLRWKNRILPLSFHVDVWNHIGWTDPFSSADWTARQRSYATAFRSNRIYTPQLVINGERDCVGSQAQCVIPAIEAALEAKPAAVLDLSVVADGPGRLRATVRGRRGGTDGGALELVVALYETDLSTRVPRGENARRTLHNDFVVRRLLPAGSLGAASGATIDTTVEIPLEAGWNRSNLGLAAFLQAPRDRAIRAATAISPADLRRVLAPS